MLVDQMAGEIDGLVEVVRTLARGLVPPVLDELGLVPAIVDLAERHRISGDLDVVVTADDVVAGHAPCPASGLRHRRRSSAQRGAARRGIVVCDHACTGATTPSS